MPANVALCLKNKSFAAPLLREVERSRATFLHEIRNAAAVRNLAAWRDMHTRAIDHMKRIMRAIQLVMIITLTTTTYGLTHIVINGCSYADIISVIIGFITLHLCIELAFNLSNKMAFLSG